MNVFTYGSLMFDRIFQQVTQSLPEKKQVTLDHWRRHQIVDKPYPAAVPQQGHMISGVVWLNLSANELRLLDDFEAHEYVREPVLVTSGDGATIAADIYRWIDASALIDKDWDPQAFASAHLTDFYQSHRP